MLPPKKKFVEKPIIAYICKLSKIVVCHKPELLWKTPHTSLHVHVHCTITTTAEDEISIVLFHLHTFFTNLCKPLIWSEYFKNKLKDFCEVYRLNKLKTDFTTWRRKTLEGCLTVFKITLHDCTLERKILRGSEILSSRLQFNLDVPFNSLDLDIQLSKLLSQVQNWFSPGRSAKIALHCVPVIFMIQFQLVVDFGATHLL